jgi:hypothetical protein
MPYLKEKIELAVAEAELKAAGGLKEVPGAVKVFAVFLLLLLVPSYFLIKYLSQKYYTNRYQAFTISAKPSFTESEPLSLGTVFLVDNGNNVYSAAGVVENPNLNLAARSFAYRFKFFGSDGRELEPISGQAGGQEYILPDQKKYLLAMRLAFGQPVKGAELEIVSPPAWQLKPELPKTKLNIEPVRLSRQALPEAFVAESFVQNQSAYQLKKIHLVFLIKDSSGRIINVSQRDEYDLKSLERRAFKQLWPNFEPGSSVRVEVYAETNLLEKENLKLESLPNSSASDLSRPELQPY